MKFKIKFDPCYGDAYWSLYRRRWWGWQRLTGSFSEDYLMRFAKKVTEDKTFVL